MECARTVGGRMNKAERITTEQARLAEFVLRTGGQAYTGVPVSGPSLGDWPEHTPVHQVDAVWFDTGAPGMVKPYDSANAGYFADAMSAMEATVLSVRGYTDRTALGMLLAGRDMLSRSHPRHRVLRCLALGGRPSWMDAVYLARGIEIEFEDSGVVRPVGSPRPGRAGHSPFEDAQLVRYFADALAGSGWLIQEVPVADRRLDGLHVPTGEVGRELEHWRSDLDVRSAVRDFDVEVIEAKRSLNTDVIGQVIAGADLIARQFPDHRLIHRTVVVSGEPDPALRWVCEKQGIRVAVVPAPW